MDQNIANYLQNQQQQMKSRQQLPPLQQPMQAATGGFGAMANLGQMQQGQFSDTHNQMYENLRKVLMQLHQSGMPGIDKVLNTLNQQHVTQMKPPTMPIQAVKGVSTSRMVLPESPDPYNLGINVQNQAQPTPDLRNSWQRIVDSPSDYMHQSPDFQRMTQQIPSLLPFTQPEDRLRALQNLASDSTYNPQLLFGADMEITPGLGNMASIIAKVKAGGMNALTPEEKTTLQNMPLSQLQQMNTGISPATEIANTHQAVKDTDVQAVINKIRTSGINSLLPQERSLLGNMSSDMFKKFIGTIFAKQVPGSIASYEGFDNPKTAGGMQEASQIAKGFPLLAELDKATHSGNIDQISNITKQIIKDPKYKPYLKSLGTLINSQKGGINFGAIIGKGQKPPTIPVEDYRNTSSIGQVQNELFKALQTIGKPNFSAMLR